MTGGQMAPTTLPGQTSQTSPYGRNVKTEGYPIKVCEMLSQLDGVAYAERTVIHDPKSIAATKKAIRKAFTVQKNKLGFSIVEILSICPTNWGMNPIQSIERLKSEVMPYYPLGVYADKTEVAK
jgi:2-oxoglutarate ferredoxin oxidoreductase subunit beta